MWKLRKQSIFQPGSVSIYSQTKLFQSGLVQLRNSMQQMELESSALLLTHVWPALPHVCQRRLTLGYFHMWQMLCRRIRTVDTDVVVLAVASFNRIAPDELWVAFGVGQSFRYIAIHQMVATMTPAKCRLFLSLTLCLHLLAEERRQPGRLGSLSQRSLMLCRNSWPCQVRSVKDQAH